MAGMIQIIKNVGFRRRRVKFVAEKRVSTFRAAVLSVLVDLGVSKRKLFTAICNSDQALTFPC